MRCHHCRGLSGRRFGRFLDKQVIRIEADRGRKGDLTCEDVLKSKLNVACIEGGSFNKGKVILACLKSASYHSHKTGNAYLQTASPPPLAQLSGVSNRSCFPPA